MSEEIIKKVQEFIDAGKGDTERLRNILNSLQHEQPLELSDQQYIESLSLTEPETKYDSITFENTSESISEPDSNDKQETNETPSKNEPNGNIKKMALAGIVIAAIVFGYIGANAYAVSTLEFRPHQGTQYAISATVLHIQAEACNPSYFPASFRNYEINAIYKSQVLETASINGSTISPKSSLLLDGKFTINKDVLSQFSQEGSQFDPNQALVKTKLDAAIFGIIPFTINKDYSGTQFADIVKNGPPGGYQC
ncbi:MAG TPA: hypothetical protein VFG24_00655 [Nitrosopumilaceae archaeon]|nr:hypothetical protein [Nitrosopumilaceae archaeon]